MNDSFADEPYVPLTGRSAHSPYDNRPTEQFPDAMTRSIPRTDDELGGEPTGHMPGAGVEEPLAPNYSFASIPASTTVAGGRSTSRIDPAYGRGTMDLGLLLLRLAVGATYIYTGLQKLTGWWGGMGVTGTRHFLEHDGWKQPKASGILVTAGELGGGALVVLGLITPLAAAALLAAAIDAWLTLQNQHHGMVFNIPSNTVLTIVLGAAAAAIILTGPGRIALDVGRGWATRPRTGSFLALLAAVAAGILAWIFLHGGNPFH